MGWGTIPDSFDDQHGSPFSFSLAAGSSNVYRGQDGVIDYDTPVAVMDPDDTDVEITGQDLPPDTIWHYVRRQVSECGLESDSSAVCIVRIDADGDMMVAMPNEPLDIAIEPVSGGAVRLRWRYGPANEQVAPTSFKIYMDSGSGYDFDSPVGTVQYGRGRKASYEWLSGQLTHGVRYGFILRAYNDGGGETVNSSELSVVVDAVGPAAITGLVSFDEGEDEGEGGDAGSSNVYRGQDGVIDYDTPVAVMDPDDTDVEITGQDLPPDTIWHYVRRQVSECGLESDSSAVCIVRIDADGDMIVEMPNEPLDIAIEPVSGGAVRLRWRYGPTNEEVAPTEFKIYMDSGSGYDFDSPVGTVQYGSGRKANYEWRSGQLTHGVRYGFILRACNDGGGETVNSSELSVVVDAVGPAAITGLVSFDEGEDEGEGGEAGSSNVYRGQDGVIDYTSPVAVMDPEETQVELTDQDLPPDTIWHYVRRQVSECGLESDSSAVCIVRIDADGDMIVEMPNKPLDIAIEPVSGGSVRLRWRYSPANEEVAPTSFKIYMDSGSGYDFDSPVGTIQYGSGRKASYEWRSGQLTHGVRYGFVLRAYNDGGGETINSRELSVVVDAVGPAAITGLMGTWELN